MQRQNFSAIAPRITICSPTQLNQKCAMIKLNARDTRYHVVRCAAKKLGWIVDNGDRVDIPHQFYGVQLRQVADNYGHHDLQNVVRCVSNDAGLLSKYSKQEDSTNCTLDTAENSTVICKNVRGKRMLQKKHTLQVIWLDKSVISARMRSLQLWQYVNHFVGMHVIARKATLFKRLSKLISLCDSSLKGQQQNRKSLLQLRNALVSMTPKSFSSVSDVSALSYYVDTLKNNAKQKYFIVKPNKGCEGRGIRIVSDPLIYLQSILAKQQDEYIIQQYIDKPMLIDGHKFDLRLYVVLTSVMPSKAKNLPCKACGKDDGNNIGNCVGKCVHYMASFNRNQVTQNKKLTQLDGVQLYIHNEGLVRMCTELYQPPSQGNITCVNMHLSNSSVNKRFTNYFVDNTCNSSNCQDTNLQGALQHENDLSNEVRKDMSGFKRDLTFLKNYINTNYRVKTIKQRQYYQESEEEQHCFYLTLRKQEMQAVKNCQQLQQYKISERTPWQVVLDRIYQCIVLTILSGVQVLRREFVANRANQLRKSITHGCFELLGFDILLTQQNLQPVLMQVNHSPSLFCDSELDFTIKQKVVRDTLTLVASLACDDSSNNDDRNTCGKSHRSYSNQTFVQRHFINGSAAHLDGKYVDSSNIFKAASTAQTLLQKTNFVQLLPPTSNSSTNRIY